jgi:hypothetical protein
MVEVISEAKLSALFVSLCTGVALTIMLNAGFRDLGFALSISGPATLVMAAILVFFATDKIKDGDKPSSNKTTKGK